MGRRVQISEEIINQIFKCYENADTTGKICLKFGMGDMHLTRVLNDYPERFLGAKSIRRANQEKKRVMFMKKKYDGPKVKVPEKIKKSPPSIEKLQKKIDSKDQRISELEKLLKIAKEELGKF